MGRMLKCQRCGVADTEKEDLEFDLVGEKKPVKKYYHKSCFQEHLKDKEFRAKESEELDKLIEVIKKIYGVKVIPNTVYPYLQDLRNGTRFFGKFDYKYKKGYTYDLIAETFEYCSDTIEYWNGRKSFNGLSGALKYGLAIVCDKLSVVEQRRKRKEEQRMFIDKHFENVKEDSHEFESGYKKPTKNKNDNTNFLED